VSKNKLIIMPINGNWEHSADFLRQTALALSQKYTVIIYDQNNAHFFLKKPSTVHYPKHKNIFFHRVKYFIPLRRINWIEKLNHQLSFWLLLQKYKNVEKVLWIFYPNFHDLSKIKNKKMISLYDCVDYSENLQKEIQLIRNVDYFFVNSLTLKKLHKNQIKKPLYIDAQGFFLPDEKKLKKPPLKKIKPTIGFVGGINYRLDFPLLNKLISKHPTWQFIFYGPRQKDIAKDHFYKTDYWLKKIKKHENVVFDQSKNRYEVYGLIQNLDVTIIPYNIKIAFNKYCYPMKIFEYLYFKKPIISSAIEELKLEKFNKFIKIAKTNSGWEKYIKDFLENQPSLIIKEQGKKLAIANSWDQKIKKILKLIFVD
jgi:hypothetical protein